MKPTVRVITLCMCTLFTAQTVFAQEVSYHTVNFTFDLPPTLKVQGEAPKTFDLKVILAGDDPVSASYASDAAKALRKEVNNTHYKIGFNDLQQVDSTVIGDLHVISILQFMQQKAGLSGSGGIMTSNIAIYTSLRNGEGMELYNRQFNDENFSTSYGPALTSSALNQLVMENAVAKSLEGFKRELTGYQGYLNTKLADLNDVKKIPELKAFEEQMKELKTALSKNGVDAFCTAAEKYLGFWQQQADNHLEKKGDEVKRAAFQNLALYYILKGNTEKARETIEAYKAVDKTESEMMGLLKYKNSEDLEKLMAKLNPEKKVLELSPVGKRITLNEAVTRFIYLKMDGTIAIEDKKNPGTYTGTLYIRKPEPVGRKGGGGIVDLGAADFDVTIKYKDNGEDKEIKTRLSKVKTLKDNNGNNYTVIKAGTNMLGDMSAVSIGSDTYILMKETYATAKISLYRIMLPQPDGSESSMLIRKAGDPKGVRTKMFNFKKNLTEYLSDCTATTEMIKQSQNLNGDINKILDTYTSCNLTAR